ncbi:MAG: helix-turn-helix transcriptional regulator [Canibacter sp.]|uniref:helix-turn-helix transcriptional regulator n=1 Tax=Yaniella sp. TaxID=2773929 RepID=UPI00264E1BAB|nr:helix-turn-helix domain-containing protein [Brevibacterium sp.]
MTTETPRTRSTALLTARDLSDLTGISVSTIYRKRSLGESLPPAVKLGSAVRWRQADVDRWIEENLEELPG